MNIEGPSKPRRPWLDQALQADAMDPRSDVDFSPAQEPGTPPVELLLRALEAHETAEQKTLIDYERLLEDVHDPAVKLLMQLLVEDERRHHDLLRRMVTNLRGDIEWTHSRDLLPVDMQPGESDRKQLVETTRMRLNEERHGVRAFRELAREHRDLYDGLFALLFEVMAMDSEKHERVLTFIEQKLESHD